MNLSRSACRKYHGLVALWQSGAARVKGGVLIPLNSEIKKIPPKRVLITGGHELGGVASFAEALGGGFQDLGIPAEVLSPSQLLRRWRTLRDPEVLKILSTTAVFAAPLARRVICIAHGVPSAEAQGWSRVIGVPFSFKYANAVPGAQVVAVSHYTAATIGGIFNVRFDGVVLNPIKPIYLESPGAATDRCYVTFVGRLVALKNVHRLLPAVLDLLQEVPWLRTCIIGDGPQRSVLEAIARGNERVEFKGNPGDHAVRECLRRTRVFISGNTTEGLGITFLEALSQGCVVAMPACGGGLELALERVGHGVQLLPISLNRAEVLSILRRAIQLESVPMSMDTYSPRAVASAYLEVDSRRATPGLRKLRTSDASLSER
jgi:glycosyltransferase involved in cell wall biosynthesis